MSITAEVREYFKNQALEELLCKFKEGIISNLRKNWENKFKDSRTSI